MKATRRRRQRHDVRWNDTDRDHDRGHVRVTKPSYRRLNTEHRETGRRNTVERPQRAVPIAPKNPGVSRKVPLHRGAPMLSGRTLEWLPMLRPGAGLRVLQHVTVLIDDDDYPYQIAAPYRCGPRTKREVIERNCIVKKNALAIYVGPVRIDERERGGKRVIRELRHVFIIGMGQYVVLDLDMFEPLKK